MNAGGVAGITALAEGPRVEFVALELATGTKRTPLRLPIHRHTTTDLLRASTVPPRTVLLSTCRPPTHHRANLQLPLRTQRSQRARIRHAPFTLL